MYWQTTPEYGGLPYCMVDIPSVTPVKKMDFTSASRYLGRGGRLCLLLFLHAGILCRSCAWGDSLCEFIRVSTLMYLENAVQIISLGFTPSQLVHRFWRMWQGIPVRAECSKVSRSLHSAIK